MSHVAAERVQLSVVVEGGLVTVDARGAPLGDVLRTIGEQAGLTVVIEGEAGARISRSLRGAPLSEAIGLLLREIPSVVIYKTSSGELAEIDVRFMGGGSASPVPAAAQRGPPGGHRPIHRRRHLRRRSWPSTRMIHMRIG